MRFFRYFPISFGLLTFLALLPACVTIDVCTQEGAYSTGHTHALEGLAKNSEILQSCEAPRRALAENQYQKGYEQGLQQLCSEASVREDGLSEGRTGAVEAVLPSRYQICSGKEQLKRIFQSSYRQGIEEFCSPSQDQQEAEELGKKGQPEAFRNFAYQVCGQQRMEALHISYRAAYERGLQRFCRADGLEEAAREQGRAHREPAQLDRRYDLCEGVSSLKQHLSQAYLMGLALYCEPLRHQDMIRRFALKGNLVAFDPGSYELCVRYLPESYEAYRRNFQTLRDHIVREQCNFEKGLHQGREDAQHLLYEDTRTPSYCEGEAYGEYRRAYGEGWNEGKRSLCFQRDPQDQGYQDAVQGKPSKERPPALCPLSFHSEYRARYELGYERGRQARPTQRD